MEQVDGIVVGAGPSGSAAAITMARGGLEVILLDKGLYPGAKNMFGGVLFTQVLEKLVPGFLEEAPLERRIVSRQNKILSEDSEVALDFRTNRRQNPPNNHMFTTFRGQFDRWFAKEAESAGAILIPKTLVKDLICEDGQFTGVRTSRRGDVEANVIVLAEGANSLLAERSGLKSESDPESFVASVKETLSLPRDIIEDRFHLKDDEGVAIEYFGGLGGIVGTGFIYTFKSHISVGLAYSIEDAMELEVDPTELLEQFKRHPTVQPLIRGGESVEYNAHLIPEAGIEIAESTSLATDGLMVVGDAGGFVNVNPLYFEGTNLAMETGRLAGKAALRGHESGDFSAPSLSRYEQDLRESWVWEDLEENSKLSKFVRENKHIIRDYPDILLDGLHEFFRISDEPKRVSEGKAAERIFDMMRPGDIYKVVDMFSERALKNVVLRELRSKLGL